MRITRVDLTNVKALLLMSDGVYQDKEPLDAAHDLFAAFDDLSDFDSAKLAKVIESSNHVDDHTVVMLRL